MSEPAATRLTIATPSDLEIVMTRVFAAPRVLVFEAYTRPEHIVRWWGPRSLTTIVEELDLRPGGRWRFVLRDAAGNQIGFGTGVYREVVPPERIVTTFEFEGMPGHESIETTTLEERAGRTTLTVRTRFQSVEDRDGMLAAGLEAGTAESYDRLAELLERLQAQTPA